VTGRLARWWRQWLSGGPGAARAPGWIQLRYRNAATSVSRHATAADAALAVVLAACATPQLVWWATKGPGGPGQLSEMTLFSALLVVPLIWRRRFPLSVFAFAAVVALAQWIVNVRLAADMTLLVYLYTVARWYPVRVGILAAAVVEAGAVMAGLRWDLTRSWLETLVYLSGLVAASLLLGVSVRHWRNSLSTLTERAEQLERDRDQQARIAVAAERTRIAREMHDVVAHSLSVMVTLSEGAALKQDAEPERAKRAMRQVSATGHQALGEMRRLLGVLRTEDAPEPLEPQPGLAQLDGLLDQVRATGLAAELTVTGLADTGLADTGLADTGLAAALPPGAELTVYRIVQEALTNTLKHAAGPTRVSVAIACQPDAVTVDVHDDGAARPAGPAGHGLTGHGLTGNGLTGNGLTGHGLTGMRERAAVYDGAVSAGPDPAGGWRVHARLPVAATAVGEPAR
jgi:signal transduction histidine kinase